MLYEQNYNINRHWAKRGWVGTDSRSLAGWVDTYHLVQSRGLFALALLALVFVAWVDPGLGFA